MVSIRQVRRAMVYAGTRLSPSRMRELRVAISYIAPKSPEAALAHIARELDCERVPVPLSIGLRRAGMSGLGAPVPTIQTAPILGPGQLRRGGRNSTSAPEAMTLPQKIAAPPPPPPQLVPTTPPPGYSTRLVPPIFRTILWATCGYFIGRSVDAPLMGAVATGLFGPLGAAGVVLWQGSRGGRLRTNPENWRDFARHTAMESATDSLATGLGVSRKQRDKVFRVWYNKKFRPWYAREYRVAEHEVPEAPTVKKHWDGAWYTRVQAMRMESPAFSQISPNRSRRRSTKRRRS